MIFKIQQTDKVAKLRLYQNMNECTKEVKSIFPPFFSTVHFSNEISKTHIEELRTELDHRSHWCREISVFSFDNSFLHVGMCLYLTGSGAVF